MLRALQLRQGHPDLLDLPWARPLAEWPGHCERLVEVPRGLSRHEVAFVAYGERIYALKELPPQLGEREYELLRALEARRLPAVAPVGHARLAAPERSVLVTEFLAGALPFRTLFMQPGLERYRERLLDAMATLLIRLHLAGFYWGDCSLSNTLFRRDAGELRAYVVDAETSEVHERLMDGQRQQDLLIMEENVGGELMDLNAAVALPVALEPGETGARIRERYDRLWAEISREEALAPHETYRIQERIRALNQLGFSVGEVELLPAPDGSQLRMRALVTDRDYHRHALHSLTGIAAGDRQATLMLNEISELQAVLARELNRSVPLAQAAFRWLNERFQPTTLRLAGLDRTEEVTELYCELLEHKWLLSEAAKRDVGLESALEDYLRRQAGTG